MKKFDLVRLVNADKYDKNGLSKDLRGIVLESTFDEANVLFFNPQILGDRAVVTVSCGDLACETAALPDGIKDELARACIKSTDEKDCFLKPKIKYLDTVRLLVDKERYNKLGAFKGAEGCVVDEMIINGFVLVDFTDMDSNGRALDDCVPIKIEDLEVI